MMTRVICGPVSGIAFPIARVVRKKIFSAHPKKSFIFFFFFQTFRCSSHLDPHPRRFPGLHTFAVSFFKNVLHVNHVDCRMCAKRMQGVCTPRMCWMQACVLLWKGSSEEALEDAQARVSAIWLCGFIVYVVVVIVIRSRGCSLFRTHTFRWPLSCLRGR
jgi:hypothetical protein